MLVDGCVGVNVYDLFEYERTDGVDERAFTELLGLLGLMDGLGRSKDGTDLWTDGADRLIDGPGLGATGRDRVVIRFCKLLRGALGMGADGTARDGLRVICGLGADRNDRELIVAPRFITCGCDRICGAIRGAALWAFWRGAAPLGTLRVRDWPFARGTISSVIPISRAASGVARSARPGRLRPARTPASAEDLSPSAREPFLFVREYIAILLSPRR